MISKRGRGSDFNMISIIYCRSGMLLLKKEKRMDNVFIGAEAVNSVFNSLSKFSVNLLKNGTICYFNTD